MDVVGVADDAPRPTHLMAHRLGERVELVGPVQRDRGDVIADVELDRLEVSRLGGDAVWAGVGEPGHEKQVTLFADDVASRRRRNADRQQVLARWVADLVDEPSVELKRRPGGGSHQAWDVNVDGAGAMVPARRRRRTRRPEALHVAPGGRDLPGGQHARDPQPAACSASTPISRRCCSNGRPATPRFARLAPDRTDRHHRRLRAVARTPPRRRSGRTRSAGSAAGRRRSSRPSTMNSTFGRPASIRQVFPTRSSPPASSGCAPTSPTRATPGPSLVQGDTGPGNFLHDGRRVTAFLDFELGHLGDPMEDLAWVGHAQRPGAGPRLRTLPRRVRRRPRERRPIAIASGTTPSSPNSASPRSERSDSAPRPTWKPSTATG